MKTVQEEIKDILQHDEQFRYMLLDRMRGDCKYFLGNGHRLNKYLWGENVKDHIAIMKGIYKGFTDEQKPEWLTMEQIEQFEKAMLKEYTKAERKQYAEQAREKAIQRLISYGYDRKTAEQAFDSRTETEALNGILNPKNAGDKKYCRWLYRNYTIIARHKSTKDYCFIARGNQNWATFNNNITERKPGYFIEMQKRLKELRQRFENIKIIIGAKAQ